MKQIDKTKNFFVSLGSYIWKRTYLFLIFFLVLNIVFGFLLFSRLGTYKEKDLPIYSSQIDKQAAEDFSSRWEKRNQTFKEISSEEYQDVFEKKF